MNIKHLLSAVLAASLLASCSKQGTETPPPGGDGPVKTQATISISIANPATGKAAHPDNTVTAEESTLYNLAIAIFDSKRMLETWKMYDFYTDNGKTGGNLYTEPIKWETEVSTGTHYFYAVANMPQTDLTMQNLLQEGMILENFERQLIHLAQNMAPIIGDETTSTSRGYMMSSKELITQSLNESDNPADNHVEVELGRVVAKVSLAFDPSIGVGQPATGVLSDVKYKVMNNPKRFYPVPNYTTAGVNNILVTPYYYSETVNRNNYLSVPAHPYQAASTDGNHTWTYATENSNQRPREGNTTVAMIQGVFTPAQNYLFDATGAPAGSPIATGTTFWRVGNVDSEGNFLNYDSGFYTADPSGTGGAIENAPNKKAYKYEDGICYYALWLKNEDATTDSKWTVKRNSYYKITVSGVRDCGNNDENGDGDGDGGPIDPEEPLDAQAMVEALIKVIDWDEIIQVEPI